MRSWTGRAAIVLLAVAVAASAGLHQRTWSRAKSCEARADTLYQQARYWQDEARNTRHRVDSLSIYLAGQHPLGPHRGDIDYLKSQGLKDPVADLAADLQHHPELIPYSGVLGGRMAFGGVNEVRVLSRNWVYTTYEDGHIGGEALLEYQVRSGGKITWRIIESHLL